MTATWKIVVGTSQTATNMVACLAELEVIKIVPNSYFVD